MAHEDGGAGRFGGALERRPPAYATPAAGPAQPGGAAGEQVAWTQAYGDPRYGTPQQGEQHTRWSPPAGPPQPTMPAQGGLPYDVPQHLPQHGVQGAGGAGPGVPGLGGPAPVGPKDRRVSGAERLRARLRTRSGKGLAAGAAVVGVVAVAVLAVTALSGPGGPPDSLVPQYSDTFSMPNSGWIVRKTTETHGSWDLATSQSAAGFEPREVNRFQVACEETKKTGKVTAVRLRLWVDGEFVAEATDQSNPIASLSEGGEGLVAMQPNGGTGGPTSVQFDNFELSQIR